MAGVFTILQLLLVLLATAHFASACSCFERTFESYFCDLKSSVIRARVISAEIVDQDGNPVTEEQKSYSFFMDYEASTRYLMQLQKKYKDFKHYLKMVSVVNLQHTYLIPPGLLMDPLGTSLLRKPTGPKSLALPGPHLESTSIIRSLNVTQVTINYHTLIKEPHGVQQLPGTAKIQLMNRAVSNSLFRFDPGSEGIVGNTDSEGGFSTNYCNVIVRWEEVPESQLDLLEGRRAPNC